MRRSRLFFDIFAEDKTGQAFSSLQKRLDASEKRLAAYRKQFMAVAAAAVAFGAAVSAAALRGARQIDESAKAARRLDASIGAFRGLELAASEAGVTISALPNELQNINREMAKIGTSGNADRAIGRLGIAANDLIGLDADEKIALIADRVQELGLSSGDASAILQDLGVRNREMVLLMMQGGSGIRSATNDIRDYGLAIDDVDARRIEQANDAISRLGLITRYAGQQLALELVPAMGRLADAMTDSLREGGLLRRMIDGLADNIQQIINTVGVAVTAFGVRYVGALALARLANISFAASLALVRRAIALTGIGVLIIGAGWLVTEFGNLVRGAGSFGNAMKLLGDLARDVWGRMRSGAVGVGAVFQALWNDFRSDVFTAMQDTMESVVGWGNNAVSTFQGAFDAIKAIWGALPDAIGNFAFQAANGLISGVESMLNGVVIRINGFLNGLNNALSSLPEWMQPDGGLSIRLLDEVDLGRITNPFEGAASAAGEAARDAFLAAFETDFIDVPDLGFEDATREANIAALQARAAFREIFEGLTLPLESWEAMRKVIADTSDETEGAAEAAARFSEALNELGDPSGGSGGGGSAGAAADGVLKLNDSLSETRDMMGSLRDNMASTFASIVTGSQKAADGLRSLLQQTASMFANRAFQQILGGLPMFGGGANPFQVRPLWAAGGYTGDGGKYDPAGTVHKGEYVFSQEATRAIGVRNLEQMHRAAKGFASGGYVGGGAMPTGAMRSAAPQINIYNNNGSEVEARTRRGPDGREMIDVVLSAVRDDYARGGFDGANKSRNGISPRMVKR